MKTLKTICNLMVLILLAGSQSCRPYAQIVGCDDRVTKYVKITSENLESQNFSDLGEGQYSWFLEVDSICSKMHMPKVEITWTISNALMNELTDYKGSVDVGLSRYPMTDTITTDVANQTMVIKFTVKDVGLKQWFEEDEPGWAFVNLDIIFKSRGSDSADLAFLKANWKSCSIYVDYYTFDFTGDE